MALPDPPPNPPPCNAIIDPLFCIRITDIQAFPGDPEGDRFLLELQFLNWTRSDCYGILATVNRASTTLVIDQPPFFAGACIDPDGRPMNTLTGCPLPSASVPPIGNQPCSSNNQWAVVGSSATRICFSSQLFGQQVGSPIPAPTATVTASDCPVLTPMTFTGLMDPQFGNASQCVCNLALTRMIPGSNAIPGSPSLIQVPDSETIDDGCNVLDGFVLDIDDWDCDEQISVDWWLLAADGSNIGEINPATLAVRGDQYGFGTFNLARLCPPGGGGHANAPPPLLVTNTTNPIRVNTGYDPKDTQNPNVDRPLFFAEDQDVAGIDRYPVNPIPSGKPGQGNWFAVEPGAAITAPTLNPNDMPPTTTAIVRSTRESDRPRPSALGLGPATWWFGVGRRK